jgi:hypothetical protein
MTSTRALVVCSVMAVGLAAGARTAAAEEPDDPIRDEELQAAPPPQPAAIPTAPAPAAPAVLPSCCCNPCTAVPPPERYVDPDRRAALTLGWTFFGVGSAIAAAHAFHGNGSLIDLVPVAGPVVGVWRNDEAPAWTAALLFSAWSQAVGVLVLALVGSDHEESLDPPTATIGRDRAVGLGLRF